MSTTTFLIPNDLSDLCRVCLQLPEESQYLDLTTIYDEEDNLTYGECFTICTQIDLSVGEGVPHYLCKSCGLELQMSYDFHKKIEESKRVIEQCQRQIKEQNEIEKGNIVQLMNEKYVIDDDDGEERQDTSEQMVEAMPTMPHENEQVFDARTEVDEEVAEVDMINKICHTEDNTQHEVPPDKDNETRPESMNENNVGGDLEEELEIDDYQNLEALEDEAGRLPDSPPISTSFETSPEFQNFVHISRPDFCANVQRYVPALTEETVIEEEISQDATEKWLDTLNDIDINPTTNLADTNVDSNEIPQIEKELLIPNPILENHNIQDEILTNLAKIITTEELTDKPSNQNDTIPQKSADSVSSSNRKTTVCTICNKSFISHNKLSWHMRMHDKNRKHFTCPVQSCDRIYVSRQACHLHYKHSHLDEGFICPTCHKTFSAKQTLEVHMRYHTKDYPYKCNICERKFGQKGHLTQHIEVKHQHLRYICTEPDCGKIFQNSVSLRNHHYTHSSMPFKCSRCDKEYPQKNKLRAHLLQKHKLDHSLDDLESMRQFNTIRTRHAYVKVQTVKDQKVADIDKSKISMPLQSEDIFVDI